MSCKLYCKQLAITAGFKNFLWSKINFIASSYYLIYIYIYIFCMCVYIYISLIFVWRSDVKFSHLTLRESKLHANTHTSQENKLKILKIIWKSNCTQLPKFIFTHFCLSSLVIYQMEKYLLPNIHAVKNTNCFTHHKIHLQRMFSTPFLEATGF